jgi:transmembrane sensor
MTNERFIVLYDKHRFGRLSDTDAHELNEWIEQSEYNRKVFERLNDEEVLKKRLNQLSKARQEDWQYILEKLPELESNPLPVVHMNLGRAIRIRRYIIAVAASAIIFVSIFYLWMNVRKEAQPKTKTAVVDNRLKIDVVAPNMAKATITLANGQIILVDTLDSGILAVQGNVHVRKNDKGEIVYSNGSVLEKNEIFYNILNNPRGSKVVSLALSDGTKVWLNSGSSLKYPIAFTGKERHVAVTGEAYFEVMRDVNKKFVVKSGDVTTEVFGTHFNVNNYEDEADIKVTLLEGSVKVSNKGKAMILKPGEQAVAGSSSLVLQNSPDLERVMAWKNGAFYFTGENLEGIMKQLARWYDVEVEYETPISSRTFGGMISRNKKLSEVLSVLELSDVHFRIEGKKIIVLK